jgi:O-antigen biosynthesis protein
MVAPETLFPSLSAPRSLTRTGPRRIAIVSVDIAGPYHCGGVGAAYHGLALALAQAGHDVTVVYLHPTFHRGDLPEWTEYFRARGVRFVHFPQAPGTGLWYGNCKEVSLRCYHWLREQPSFEFIHFHEWLGLPYYSLVAKKLGLAFAGTTLCVGTHGSMRWSREGDEELISRSEDLVVDFLERKSVELADVVVSPSQYLLRWMSDAGWNLPRRCYVANNILEPLDQTGSAGAPGDPFIRELVFFGRLDRRKGLPFFCDVLDRLRSQAPFEVTFLGADVAVDGRLSADYIRMRGKSWSFEWSLLTSCSRTRALEYLLGSGRLAVIPSQTDNSPCTVQECLQEGIPFLSSDRGGIPELIHPEDRARATVPLQPDAFAARLAEILESGQGPARAAESLQFARDRWRQWHDSFTPPAEPPPGGEPPLISVCIAHYEDTQRLDQMLASLRAQTYAAMEVVVVDDGSPSDETRSYLTALHQDFAARNWQLLRQESAGPGIARDRAARAAKGSYLLFADDHHELLPHTLDTFARAAAHSGADALSCVSIESEGDVAPPGLSGASRLLIPLGPALAAGLIYPEFSGPVYMLKRECYDAIGGFPPEREVDADWELTLNVVARGYNLHVIPEALVWCRKPAEARSHSGNRFARDRSRIRIYEKMLPFELRDLASLGFVRLSRVAEDAAQQRLRKVAASLEQLRKQRLAERPAKPEAT